MRYAVSIILLFLSLAAFGQLSQFRMVGSGSWSVVNDSTYSATVTFAADLTANSFLPTGVVDSMRVFTQRGQVYTIDSVGAKTFSTAVIYAVEYGGDWGSPSGQVLVYETRGLETVPAIPFATNGATSKLQEAVVTHNAAINNGISSATLADSTAAAKTYTNNQVAAVAPAKDTIVQASHGFSLGDPLWYSGDYILALDTGTTVRVDGIISEVPDANTFVLQRTGRFTLASHGFTVGVQLYVQPDGSYSATDTSNTLVYGYALDANTIEIGVKPDAVRATVKSRTFEFSRKTLESITRAKNNRKTWVISDTVTISGSLDVSDLDIIFEKNGFISGADTITASGATIQANKSKKLWSESTIISGDWNVDLCFLEWTIGGTRTNRTNNFRALTNCIEMDAEVRVQGFEYELSTATTSTYHVTNEPLIRIVGEKDAAFTLYTRHSTSSRGAYIVDTLDGFNIWIENIIFETDEYQAGTKTNSQRYQFIRSMYDATAFPNVKPYADYVVFQNNTFHGDIRMLFFGTDGSIIDENELAGLGIRKLVVEGNITDQTGNTIRVSQVPFGTVDIKNNRSTNIREVFVRLTTSGLTAEESAVRSSLNYIINVSNNKINGDEVIPTIASGSSLGYVLSEGGDLRVYDNVVDGIYVNDQGEEVWFVYGNSRTIDMRNNRIMNIFNPSHWLAGDPGSLSALRFKACPNVQVHNNTFGLTREGLRTAGLLDSTYNVAAISKDSFWYSLYSSDNNQISDDTTGTSILEISGNTFLSPIVNAEGSFAHQNVKFTNNNIVVDYFYQTYAAEAENICALFDFTEGPSATYTYDNRNLIQNGNTVTVKHSDCGAVEVFSTDQNLLDAGEADTVYQSIATGNIFVLDTSAYAYPIHFSDRVERTEKILSKNGAGITWSGPFNEAQFPLTQTNSEYNFTVNKYRDYATGVWAHLNNGDMELKYQQSVDTVLTVEGIPLNWRGRGHTDTIPPVIDIRLTTYDSIGLPLENHYRVAFAFSEASQSTAFNGFMYWNGSSVVYQAVSSDNSYQITALYEENPNIRLVYSYELGTFSAFVNRYLRLYGEDLSGKVKLQIKMISFPFVSTAHSDRADELELYLTPKTAIKTFPGNVVVTGTLTAEKYHTFQPIQYNALDTITIDTLNTAFAITPDLNGLDVTNATYTTNANVSTNTTIRLLYYDVSADTYTVFGSGTITSATNQIQVTGLTQAVTAGDWIYAEVTASGGEANGLSVNLRFQ